MSFIRPVFEYSDVIFDSSTKQLKSQLNGATPEQKQETSETKCENNGAEAEAEQHTHRTTASGGDKRQE